MNTVCIYECSMYDLSFVMIVMNRLGTAIKEALYLSAVRIGSTLGNR